MLSTILKFLAKLTLLWAGVGVKQKNKKRVSGYYFDGKKMRTLYERDH